MDIGDDFCVNSSVNGQILGDVLYDLVSKKNDSCAGQRNFIYLFPYDRVRSGSRVVIYGAGVVGQDYMRQLEMCEYCSEVIQVDRNWMSYRDVRDPVILKEIECDHVVIAANLINVREEMRKDILKIAPQLKERIIEDACYIIRF